jgi:outer membrane receptor protein involved in Fe transport
MTGGTPNVYEQPFGQLNFSLSKDLGNKFKIKVSANNLLNPEYKQTQEFKGKEYIFQSYKRGRTFGISITYKIN